MAEGKDKLHCPEPDSGYREQDSGLADDSFLVAGTNSPEPNLQANVLEPNVPEAEAEAGMPGPAEAGVPATNSPGTNPLPVASHTLPRPPFFSQLSQGVVVPKPSTSPEGHGEAQLHPSVQEEAEEQTPPGSAGAYVVGFSELDLKQNLRLELEQKEAVIDDLQERLDLVTKQKDEAEKQKDEAERKLKDNERRHEAEDAAKNKEIDRLKNEVDKLKIEKSKFEKEKKKENDARKREYEMKVKELQEALANKKRDHETEKAVLERKIAENLLKISQMETTEQRLRCQLAEARESTAQAKVELAEMRQTRAEETARKSEESAQKSKESAQKSEQKQKELEKKAEEIEKENEEVKAELKRVLEHLSSIASSASISTPDTQELRNLDSQGSFDN